MYSALKKVVAEKLHDKIGQTSLLLTTKPRLDSESVKRTPGADSSDSTWRHSAGTHRLKLIVWACLFVQSLNKDRGIEAFTPVCERELGSRA